MNGKPLPPLNVVRRGLVFIWGRGWGFCVHLWPSVSSVFQTNSRLENIATLISNSAAAYAQA